MGSRQAQAALDQVPNRIWRQTCAFAFSVLLMAASLNACIVSSDDPDARFSRVPGGRGALMGYFRFRRSIQIPPSCRLTRTTVGLPGTGLSCSHVEKSCDNAFNAAPASDMPKGNAWRPHD